MQFKGVLAHVITICFFLLFYLLYRYIVCKFVENKRKEDMNPSAYACYPWDSIFRKSEAETVALNVIKILKRTGDNWRQLEWSEYKEERLKDGHFEEKEKDFFEMVAEYCSTEHRAAEFSAEWGKIYESTDIQ